jgi:hypothetical protein
MTASYLLKNTVLSEDTRKKLALRFGVLLLTSILSQVVLLMSYIPSTIYALKHASPNGIISWDLISPLGYQEKHQRIVAAAESCHIPLNNEGHHIVIDNSTYMDLKASYQPMMCFIYGPGLKEPDFKNPEKFFAFMHKSQSSGLITDCSSLPSKILPYATEASGFCCISKERIDELSKMFP